MAGLYCDHERLADACEHCLAQAAGFTDAFDGPAARLPGRTTVEASAEPHKPAPRKSSRRK